MWESVVQPMAGIGSVLGTRPATGVPPLPAQAPPSSRFLLKEGLSRIAGPPGLQRPNGMQIGICSHKDVLCMDFPFDYTWELIIHHLGRACTTSRLCQQFLVIWYLLPNTSPSAMGSRGLRSIGT